MFLCRTLLVVLSTPPLAAAVRAAEAPKPALANAAQSAAPTAPATPKPSRFDQIDTNHDGFITRDEFMASEEKRFDEFDSNHDKKIDAKEIASSPPLMERNLRTAERMVKQWDTNDDGVVTADEYRQSAEKRFAQQDKEGTGKIARRVPGAAAQRDPKPPQAKQPVPPAKTQPVGKDSEKK